MSQTITTERGILAGCPFATMTARVYLGPVLQEASSLPRLEATDTWVDDIGADFGDTVPEKAAERLSLDAATFVACFKRSKLEARVWKIGFVALSALALRFVNAWPAVKLPGTLLFSLACGTWEWTVP